MKQKYYYILAFSSTCDVMAGEKYAKDKINAAIMPLPQGISSGCGLALRFLKEELPDILAFCEEIPMICTLYKMNTEKVDGVRKIEKIYERIP